MHPFQAEVSGNQRIVFCRNAQGSAVIADPYNYGSFR
jgi:hypothetical protein